MPKSHARSVCNEGSQKAAQPAKAAEDLFSMVWKPHVTVAAVVEHEKQFLMVAETIAGRRVINQPAGHLEPGENLLEAVSRETLEETGYRFRASSLVGIYQWRPDHGTDGQAFLRFAFAGEIEAASGGTCLSPEIDEVLWVQAGELARRADEHRSPLVVRCVDDYLSGRRYPLSILTALA